MEQLAGDLLRRKGLRGTAQRRAALTALQGRPHSTAADLETRIGTDRAALVRCIEPAGSPARYELRVGDNHHRLVCRRRGLIEDVDCGVGAAPCLTPGEDRGFAVDEAEITWWGLCAQCRQDTAQH
ncbi:transcriptional repressor [Streptomyces sp. NPDC086777]|uniref:Fur family transcriptional regulator n=1 Tax=Streptomyces sp. NPDC086777 TaxID=3154866 RepID=UPI00344FF5E7